jgi:nicotinamidase-related amidase|tara:strand:- start:362 stop:949 length:588 start_codon:yes stop_codon:yes gene_type:complete
MDLPINNLGLGARPALIVVDMCLGFTDPLSPLGFECEDTILVNQKVIEVCREKDLPIFFTTTVYRDDSEASVFRRRLPDLNILVPGSDLINIHPELNAFSSDFVIEKNFASPFFNTNLSEQLFLQEVDSIIVTGLTTSGCVRATVLDGLQYNLVVTVVADGVNDRNKEAHLSNLRDMNNKYADVMSSKRIINLLD